MRIKWGLGIGDWGLGIGDWVLCIGTNPQSPIPKNQHPNTKFSIKILPFSQDKQNLKLFSFVFLYILI